MMQKREAATGARRDVWRRRKVIEREKTDGKIEFKRRAGGRGVRRDSFFFFVHVWREWEALIHLTAWRWPGRRARLVCTAGFFPERAAQGRGTCSRLRHWSRGEAERRAEGLLGWKDAWWFQETDMCWIYENLQVETEQRSRKKILLLGFSLWNMRRRDSLSLISGWNKKCLLSRRTKVMVGASWSVLATLPTQAAQRFMDWPACQLRQYFPSIWLGWPNSTYLRFIKHSVIPANPMEDSIIWDVEF